MEEPRRRDRRPSARAFDRSGQREAEARRGLQAWAEFPAGRQPRPLVLLSSAALSGAFPDGQAKLAFYDGLVTAGPDFPAPVLRALSLPPRSGREVPPLFLTRANLGETWFDTDRGRQTLPAWCVWVQDVARVSGSSTRPATRPPGPAGPSGKTGQGDVADARLGFAAAA